ncbi:excalibur calcium-binding domain-containing protein [Spirillospora sp. NPDC048832]
MTADSSRPVKRYFLAALAALAMVLLLGGLASCGGEAHQKASRRSGAPSPPQSSSPAEPPDEGESPSSGSRSSGLDPRFRTCAQANAAGYGPYVKGADPEYDWYQDRDQDGIDCEFPGGGPSGPSPASPPTEEPSLSEEPSAPSETPSDSGPSPEPPSSEEPSEPASPGDTPSTPESSEESSGPSSGEPS